MIIGKNNNIARFKNPYTSSGLISMWDALWNRDFGYGMNDNCWKDLVNGRMSNEFPDNVYFDGDSLEVDNMKNAVCIISDTVPSAYLRDGTVEFVIDSVFSDYDTVIISFNGQPLYKNMCGLIGSNFDNRVSIVGKGGNIDAPVEKLNKVRPDQHISIYGAMTFCSGQKIGNFCYVDGKLIWQWPWGHIPQYEFNYGGIMIGARNSVKIKSIRTYSRILTDDEIAHDYMVDKRRFGL